MNKTKKLFIYIAAAAAVLGIPAFVVPQTAQAAPAKCYEAKEGQYVNKGSCIGYTVPGGRIEDDKCYTYPPGAPPGGQLTATDCNGIEFLSLAPKCYTNPADASRRTQVSCNTLFSLRQSAGRTDLPQSGKCYDATNALGDGGTEVDCTTFAPVTTPAPGTPPANPGGTAPGSPPAGSFGNLKSDSNLPVEDSPLFKDYIVPAINILSGGAVALAAIFIVVAGIQYSAGRDNPQLVAGAKAKILNVLIGLIAYAFIYGFLQFIIPGGLL